MEIQQIYKVSKEKVNLRDIQQYLKHLSRPVPAKERSAVSTTEGTRGSATPTPKSNPVAAGS